MARCSAIRRPRAASNTAFRDIDAVCGTRVPFPPNTARVTMRYPLVRGIPLFRSISYLAAVSVLAAAVSAPAQFDMPLNHTDPKLEAVTIRETVARYCRLDYAGARLNPSDWPKLQPLVTWPSNPEYSFFMPTSRFDVDADVTGQRGKYLVTVHYRLLGRFDIAQGYSAESADHVEDVQFSVAEVNGDWRITGAQPNHPHPSRAATLQWLNKQLASSQEQASKLVFQHAIEALQSQKTAVPVR